MYNESFDKKIRSGDLVLFYWSGPEYNYEDVKNTTSQEYKYRNVFTMNLKYDLDAYFNYINNRTIEQQIHDKIQNQLNRIFKNMNNFMLGKISFDEIYDNKIYLD